METKPIDNQENANDLWVLDFMDTVQEMASKADMTDPDDREALRWLKEYAEHNGVRQAFFSAMAQGKLEGYYERNSQKNE